MVNYELQCIFTYLSGDPRNNPWCDLIQSWFPSKKWNDYKTGFLIFESCLGYKSHLAYFTISKEWNSLFPSHLTLEPGAPFIYFSLVCLFIQSTSVYEKPILRLAQRHWDAGMSSIVEVIIQSTECAVLEVTFRIQSSSLLLYVCRRLCF